MSAYFPAYSDAEDYDDVFSPVTEPFATISPRTATREVVILEPTSFDEMPEAIAALRRQQMVVLNLVHMDHQEAQRSVDFLAGGTTMFNGALEKIDHRVFIFAPHNTDIYFDGEQQETENDAIAPTIRRPQFSYAHSLAS